MLEISGSTAESSRNSKIKQLEDLKFVILATVKCQYFFKLLSLSKCLHSAKKIDELKNQLFWKEKYKVETNCAASFDVNDERKKCQDLLYQQLQKHSARLIPKKQIFQYQFCQSEWKIIVTNSILSKVAESRLNEKKNI